MSRYIITDRIRLFFCIMLSLNLLEGLITFISIVTIPSDPKNAFVFGYSVNRLVLLMVSALLLGFLIALFINLDKVLNKLGQLVASAKVIQAIKWAGVFAAICLWLTVWLPVNRLEIWEASFVRIKPLLLWLEFIILQFSLFLKLGMNKPNLDDCDLKNKSLKKSLLIFFFTVVIGVVLFGLLRFVTPSSSGDQLLFPPGAPLSSLQLFFAWLIFVGFFLLGNYDYHSGNNKTSWVIATFFLIWLTVFIVWNSIPFNCAEDRPGPFPPNNLCYPTINDAVYTIGSHYITLGEGIYNDWQTDKPLYLIFLAVGQWIAGTRIDQYLIFQIAILALIPALLFLLAKRNIGFASGVFLALLSLFVGANEIHLYRMVGGVNVKLENPELLTALLLILLCFSIFKWFIKTNKPIWAAISGGLFGLLTLIRLNPIFIAPVLLLVIIIASYQRKKSPFTEIVVFLIAFTLVFSPMIFSARDSQGNNYYWAKIRNVISQRYSITPTTRIDTYEQPAQPNQQVVIQNTSPQNEIINELSYPTNEITQGGGASILFHFLNNEYSSLAILPVNISFISLEDQVKQSIWDFLNYNLIWEREISLENVFVLILNFALIIVGICYSVKKIGFAGLSALIIQVGYHLGNAFAKTSGGRYLQPVNWVTLLYFSIGIFVITSSVIKLLQQKKEELIPLQSEIKVEIEKPSVLPPKKKYKHLVGLMVIFLIVGLSIPLINQLPSLLPEENNSETNQLAKMKLVKTSFVTTSQWDNFLNDPDHYIVRGKAYDAQYYRSNFYKSDDLSFELMLLSKDHVFVNYLSGVEPDKPFADGSDVILVGCKVGQDNMWNADRIILRSFAVIQLDQENGMYIDPNSNWKCTK